MRRSIESPLIAGLAHIACCGLPLLALAVAAGAIALVDAAAIAAGVGVLAIAGALWWRRRCACESEDPGDRARGDQARGDQARPAPAPRPRSSTMS